MIVATYATQGSSCFTTMTAALAISVGLALTIIAGQLPAFFGVEKGSGDSFQKVWDVITKFGDTR